MSNKQKTTNPLSKLLKLGTR